MTKRPLPTAFLPLFSAALLMFLTNGYPEKTIGQESPQRPKFYALEVVSEKKVEKAMDSLGEPDGRSAEILPGGQLIILMEKILSPSRIVGYGENQGCTDSGSIVGKGEGDFGLEGRFTWKDAPGEVHYEWIRLGPTATGFCLFPPPGAHYSLEEGSGVDVVKMTNTGTKPLFVDAVVGFEYTF
jgi:hypothetical protein